MKKRIAVILFDGVEDIELFSVIDLLYRANYQVDTFSFSERKNVTTRSNVVINSNFLLEEMNSEIYDLLFIPGGPGVSNISSDNRWPKLLEKFKNKWIAAICAAPSILSKNSFISNRKVTSHPTVKKEVLIDTSNYSEDGVVQDKGLVTAKNLLFAIPLGLKIVEILENKDAVIKLKENI